MRRINILLCCCMLLFTLSGTAVAQQTFLKHSFGETIITGKPKRVAVLDNGALELFQKLGIPVVAVPSDLPGHLSAYNADGYVKAGTAWKPDMEAVKKAKPDLIILGGWQTKAYEELNRIAPTIGYGEDGHDYMASFVANLKNIGQLFGKQPEVDRLLIHYYDEINQVRKLTAADTSRALVLLYTQGQYGAYGSRSRFGFIHDALGVKTSNDTLSTAIVGTLVNDDLIIKTNPDYIFLVDRDKAFKKEQPDRESLITPAMKQTNAYKKGKIIMLSNSWYFSGNALTTLETKIREVRNGLYGQ